MAEPKIIYEDEDFLAVDKPAGLMVHAAKLAESNKRRAAAKSAAKNREARPTLVDWLLARYPQIATVGDDPAQRPGIVHRLDKDTSGVMLVAKNQKTFEYLKSLFQKHEIAKTYLAAVWGEPAKKSGVIDAPIGIKNGTTKRSVRSTKMAKEAITEWKLLKTERAAAESPTPPTPPTSLLEVKPKTGRTHQIRVHLASIGHAIVGDVIYGTKNQQPKANNQLRLMLHAYSIEFTAPDGKRMKIEAQPPSDFLPLIHNFHFDV